jgi:hypothetical protein
VPHRDRSGTGPALLVAGEEADRLLAGRTVNRVTVSNHLRHALTGRLTSELTRECGEGNCCTADALLSRGEESLSGRSAGLQISFLCSARGHYGISRAGRAGIVPENETILYRGARYEIGRGQGFYGIWPAEAPRPQSIEWWPETPEGWHGAWSRFTGIETPGTIVPVSQRTAAVASAGTRAVIAAALLAIGAACGIAGLFPGYLAGASLAQEPAELVPHAIYLAVWSASALLILLGGARLRAGAFLGLGTSIVTFGLFFADAGTAIAGGAHLMGIGLVLGLVGWLACAAGSAMAFRLRPAGAPRRPHWHARRPVLTLALATVAALGAAAAFAPSWDSYTLRTSAGATQSLTAGNAFANPAPMIAGNVAVMVALVVVVAAAALWHPIRLGAVLLAGATIPMAAQAISALVLLGEATSPAQFGISPAQAAQAGLTISSGVTPAFWIYCAFVLALAVTCAWMLILPRSAAPGAAPGAPPPAAGMVS